MRTFIVSPRRAEDRTARHIDRAGVADAIFGARPVSLPANHRTPGCLGQSSGGFVPFGIEGVLALRMIAIVTRFDRLGSRAALATTLLTLPIFVTALAAVLIGSAPA